MQRWTVVLAAAAGVALLAAGFALAMGQLVSGSQPAPRLKTFPASALAANGVSLSAARQPPYCGIEQAAAQRGWRQPGWGGCAIGQKTAEAVAAQGGSVVESLLARASMPRFPQVGSDHLVWLVVVHPSAVVQPMIRCAAQGPQPAACPLPAICRPTGTAQTTCPRVPGRIQSVTWLVILDGYSGRVLTDLPAATLGGGGPLRGLPPVVTVPAARA